MKKPVFIFLFLSIWAVKAQDRTLVHGLITNNDSIVKNVHVRNISSGKFSLSGNSGEFSLSMGVGDTLLFTHVGMQDLIAYVKEDDLQKNPLPFVMTNSSMELREVVVNETSEINAVSLGIIPKKIEKLTLNERRLRQAGDFKPKHLIGIIAGGVSFDAILNAINGRTKKLKRNITYEVKERNIAFLEINYMQYMQKEMKLSEHETRLLINHAIEDEELSGLISLGNEARIQFFLQGAWVELQSQYTTE